jgi:uncharacterized protein YraI
MEALMRGRCQFKWLVMLLLAVPFAAVAQNARTLRPVNVRAGPDQVFPLVTSLSPRTEVYVVGCTEGWHWCDIVAGRTHGWVSATNLSGPIRNPRIPFVKFSIGPYWDANYRGRPWYSSRADWANWGTPSFRPPPLR